MNIKKIEQLVRELLIEIGENPDRKELLRTPYRVAQMWKILTSGYYDDINIKMNNAYIEQDCNIIINRNIKLYSLCEHHLLPFFGTCHIAYQPNKKVIGLSKLTRITQHCARKLQLQERLTNEIAQLLQEKIHAKGVAVMLNCRHLCNEMRGVEETSSHMITCVTYGDFSLNETEFINLINASKK